MIKWKDLQAQLQNSKEFWINWINEGEKPSRSFCSLEKKNYISKTIYKIQKDDGTVIKEQTEIINELEKFYQNLFSAKLQNEQDAFHDDCTLNINAPILSFNEFNALEGQINCTEATTLVLPNIFCSRTLGFSADFL